nr:hypothetical protein [uncultured Draconibacterium sp.]
MKAITKKYNSDILDKCVFENLTTNELSEVRGGGTPKTRDKDIFDFEEE